MVGQTPKDTPFGLEANVAAGLAYLLGLIGGIVMLVGGGTNKFVKWAAAQSITLFVVYIGVYIVLDILVFVLSAIHLGALSLILMPVMMIFGLLVLIAYVWCIISAFQGKEVRLPVVAGLTQQFFGSQLG